MESPLIMLTTILMMRAADRSQRLLADKAADNDRVNGVVKLLEKRAEEYREKEQHQLLPDNTLGDPVIF